MIFGEMASEILLKNKNAIRYRQVTLFQVGRF